jgi:hypothetical protein
MPKLTTKYSVLALNPIFWQKMTVYRSQIMVYQLFSGFMIFFIFLNLERILKIKPGGLPPVL